MILVTYDIQIIRNVYTDKKTFFVIWAPETLMKTNGKKKLWVNYGADNKSRSRSRRHGTTTVTAALQTNKWKEEGKNR